LKQLLTRILILAFFFISPISAFSQEKITLDYWELPTLHKLPLPKGALRSICDITTGINGGIWISIEKKEKKETKKKKSDFKTPIGMGQHLQFRNPLSKMNAIKKTSKNYEILEWVQNTEDANNAGFWNKFIEHSGSENYSGLIEGLKDGSVTFFNKENQLCATNGGNYLTLMKSKLNVRIEDYAISPKDKTFWFMTRTFIQNATKNKKQSNKGLKSNPWFLSIDIDKNGAVWAIDSNNGIIRFNKNTQKVYSQKGARIRCAPDGSMWAIGDDYKSIYSLYEEKWILKGKFSKFIKNFAFDHLNGLWVITESEVWASKEAQKHGFEYAAAMTPQKNKKIEAPNLIVDFKYSEMESGHIWNDKGSGGDFDISYWRVKCPNGYVRFGDYAKSSWGYPHGAKMLIAKENNKVMKKPNGYKLIYNDKGSGADKDLSIWEPIPPKGYVALGHVAQRGYRAPSKDYIRCVKADFLNRKGLSSAKASLVTRGRLVGPIYIDKGTGADMYCSTFVISIPAFDDSKLRKKIKFKNGIPIISKKLIEKMARAQKKHQSKYLFANTFFAANDKKWKVKKSSKNCYVLNAPSKEDLARHYSKIAYKKWLPNWNKWRTYQYKKEKTKREKLAELLQKSNSNPVVNGLPKKPVLAQKWPKEEKIKLPPQKKKAIQKQPIKPKQAPKNLPKTILEEVSSIFKKHSKTSTLKLSALPFFKKVPFADQISIKNFEIKSTASHIIITAKASFMKFKDKPSFITIHLGPDKTPQINIGITSAKEIKIYDLFKKSSSGLKILDKCFSINQTALIISNAKNLINGKDLNIDKSTYDHFQPILSPYKDKEAFSVMLEKGINLFCTCELKKKGLIGALNNIPYWPDTFALNAVIDPTSSDDSSLTGVVPFEFPNSWPIQIEKGTIGFSGSGELTVGLELAATILGRAIIFNCALQKALKPSTSLNEFSIIGSCKCGNSDCVPPCKHTIIKLLNFGISHLVLSYTQKLDPKTKRPVKLIGLSGKTFINKKEISLATMNEIPPNFANAAFKGETSEAITFEDILKMAMKVIPGINKVPIKIINFGIAPLKVETKKIVKASFAQESNPDLGIKQGISLSGKLMIEKMDLGEVFARISKKTGITINSHIEAINLANGAVKLTGENKKGPEFTLKLNHKEQFARITAKASLLGIANKKLTAELTPGNISVSFSDKIFNAYEAEVLINGNTSIMAKKLDVAIMLKSDFINKLKSIATGKLNSILDKSPMSVFSGPIINIYEVIGRATLANKSNSKFDMTVKCKIMGTNQTIKFADFDFASPEKSMEKLAEKISDEAKDLNKKRFTLITKGIKETAKYSAKLLKKTGVDLSQVNKSMGGIPEAGYIEAEKQINNVVNISISTIGATMNVASKVTSKIKDSLKSVWKKVWPW
jgi:hypothetical protein